MDVVVRYLTVIFLGAEPTLSENQVKSGAGHQYAVAQIPKHHGKQEGEGDDSVGRWTQTRTNGNNHVNFGEGIKLRQHCVPVWTAEN